jgi:CheY-like chemotaxis protein
MLAAGRPLRPPPAVLVLASAASVRTALARVAREHGYRAIEADDPAELLRRLRTHPAMAQLLLVEVSLPGMDGGEVAERARDLAPGLRTAFLSDDPEGADAELIGAYPELLVLPLPFDREAVAALMRAALGRPRAGAPPGERRRQRRSGRFGSAGEIPGPGRI